jgi:hypothetical protein
MRRFVRRPASDSALRLQLTPIEEAGGYIWPYRKGIR